MQQGGCQYRSLGCLAEAELSQAHGPRAVACKSHRPIGEPTTGVSPLTVGRLPRGAVPRPGQTRATAAGDTQQEALSSFEPGPGLIQRLRPPPQKIARCIARPRRCTTSEASESAARRGYGSGSASPAPRAETELAPYSKLPPPPHTLDGDGPRCGRGGSRAGGTAQNAPITFPDTLALVGSSRVPTARRRSARSFLPNSPAGVPVGRGLFGEPAAGAERACPTPAHSTDGVSVDEHA